MPALRDRPVVGIVCDLKHVTPHDMHAAGDKYVRALVAFSGALPLLIPVTEPPLCGNDVLDAVDGLFLPGSPSNVSPAEYGGPAPREGNVADARRDATALPLIRRALARRMPLLAVCRGFQEMNVALGGTLHQHLHEIPSEPGFAPRLDHREDTAAPLETRYGPAHEVTFTAGGLLRRVTGITGAMVNSLHGQGVDRLSEHLCVEALAADGTIEAARATAGGFALGVQWHPEYRAGDTPHNEAILRAFGTAMRQASAD